MLDRSEIPVFVIDDDRDLSTMIERALLGAGFKNVRVANTADDALKAISSPPENGASDTKTIVSHENGVVILDVVLPDMSGFDLSKRIKELFPDNLVLMISGFDIEELNKRLIESEADDFLTKPFNPLELVARIGLLVERRSRKRPMPVAGAPPQAPAGTSSNRVPHIGDWIDDYLILDSLGWGKNSVIYKAVHKPDDSIFAIKMLTKYSMEFKDVVARFEQEMKVMSRLDHPNIIRFYKTGSWDACPYIVMEYMYGINLEEHLVAAGAPPPSAAISASLQIASGVEAMHSAGVLHRDIKLKNIMIEPDSSMVKLADFGIARIMDSSPGVTRDGFIIGTPMYMPPEIFRGECATVESDVYSYGVTAYHYVTGSPPFSSARNSELYKRHLNETPRPMRDFNPAIPAEFDSLIVGRCMAKRPEDRPASMSMVVEELDNIRTRMESAP